MAHPPCVFCREPISAGDRATRLNARSATRLLRHAPDESLADGSRRWYGHAECVSAAGQEWAAESRREAESWLPALDSLPDSPQELATLLAELEEAVATGYDRFTSAKVKRYHDSEKLDALLRTGDEPEPALRYLMTIRAIGHRLNETGRKPLMRDVAHLAELQSRRHILRHIEMHWDGIGDWQG